MWYDRYMQEKFRILVVEDEVAIRTGLVDVLVFHGYDVEAVGDGRDGLMRARSDKFDLILLDVMLPSLDGFSICDEIRQADPEQPVIMLTAKVSEEDIITGLKLGADDYVAKPFSVAELVLRVQAVLRRSHSATALAPRILFADGLEVDTLNLAGVRANETLHFTRREVEILQYLHAHAERPVSRDELLSEVWGYAKGLDIETRTVDIHIAKLRRKMEVNPKNPANLITIRGVGYRLMSAQ